MANLIERKGQWACGCGTIRGCDFHAQVTEANVADDKFWNRDVVAKMWDAATANDPDTSPIIDRQVDRTDGLMAAVMFGCVGAFAGAVANPDRWEVPAFALFALFVVLLFGKNVDF